MKKYLIVCLIFVLLFVAAPAFAEFAITFKNDTSEKVFYTLKWWDHDLDHFGPVRRAGGELMPSAEHTIDYNYKGKIWTVYWSDPKSQYPSIEYQLPIGDSLYHFTVTPSGGEIIDVFKSVYNWTFDAMLSKLPFKPDADQAYILLKLKQPKIYFVTREELGKKWLLYNKDCIARWKKKYGEEKAKEYVDFYLNESKAFLISKTKEIFIWDKLIGIDRDSTIAHEITHYFQDALELPYPNCDKDDKMFYREMQAQQIQDIYMEERKS